MFRPARPQDSQQVLSLYAIAARAVCARPESTESISAALIVVTKNLVPPERIAADECEKLWGLFVRVATLPKPKLRSEAGRAMYRDLESIGQRLDLPPLTSWEQPPDELDAPDAIDPEAMPADDVGTSVDEVRADARKRLDEHKKKRKKKEKGEPSLPPPEVLGMLRDMRGESREKLLSEAVGKGIIMRNDSALLQRVISLDTQVGKGDDVLREGLESLGKWLVG